MSRCNPSAIPSSTQNYIYPSAVKFGYCPPFLSFRMVLGITRKGEPKGTELYPLRQG